MFRVVACCILAFPLFAASTWKLVRKDGSTVECDGAPVIINGEYLFRGTDGNDGTLPADQVDREKTDGANKVAPPPRQWRLIGQSVQDLSSGAISPVNDAHFESEVLESDAPVLVEFWATWCGFCKKMEPTLQSVAGDYAGRVNVRRLDIDRNPVTAHRYGVTSVPTLILFDRGRVAGTIHGAAQKASVVRMLGSLSPGQKL